MGEKQNQPFQLLFNASLKVDFQGSRVTSDGGLILVRELDERLGLEKLIEEHLSDSRQGLNKKTDCRSRRSASLKIGQRELLLRSP
jgi:predicted ribosome quality control (RQC) complex YloA/Tae2 family protein